MTIEEYDFNLEQLTEAKQAFEVLAKQSNEIVKALDKSIEGIRARRNVIINMEAILNRFRELLERESEEETECADS